MCEATRKHESFEYRAQNMHIRVYTDVLVKAVAQMRDSKPGVNVASHEQMIAKKKLVNSKGPVRFPKKYFFFLLNPSVLHYC